MLNGNGAGAALGLVLLYYLLICTLFGLSLGISILRKGPVFGYVAAWLFAAICPCVGIFEDAFFAGAGIGLATMLVSLVTAVMSRRTPIE